MTNSYEITIFDHGTGARLALFTRLERKPSDR
jgi:hypothetical protein